MTGFLDCLTTFPHRIKSKVRSPTGIKQPAARIAAEYLHLGPVPFGLRVMADFLEQFEKNRSSIPS
jgi:hypothetical protein